VTVLTDAGGSPSGRSTVDGIVVHRTPMRSPQWGIVGVRALKDRVRIAMQIRRMFGRGDGTVHCARALPEGLSALLAHLLGGPRYACWAHGEELATAQSSRELTLLTRWVYRLSEAAIANSRNTAAMLEQSYGIAPSKIRIVYPAVDADRFRPEVDGSALRRRFANDGDIVILSVGRLQRRKGHDVAIRALNALRHELPVLKYVIAGDGEERAALERLVAECGLEKHVSFAGIVGDDVMPQLYTACDIFLLPNREDGRDIEGFGIVFLEAAAAGRPAIGGNSGGVPEAIVDGVTGLLVDGASVDSVADAIRFLATSPDVRTRMGEAGRRRVRAEFTWERAVAKVSTLV
jgi:phosphatidyl-myo-inositol dimannoside synthase